MNSEILLDAIGMIDDSFIQTHHTAKRLPLKKIAISLIAAILLFSLSVGTAMALSEEFREAVFSIFNINTHDTPPVSEGFSQVDGAALYEIETVNIDNEVTAHYFKSEGLVFPIKAGFYTCSADIKDTPPKEASFWQIEDNGIQKIETSRADFSIAHKGKEFRIVFDHAVVNGSLCIKIWPQGLADDPVGNGWNIEPIGERLDIALLSIPVRSKDDYTHDILLLDLKTFETKMLIDSDTVNSMDIYGCFVTTDLRYALLAGIFRADASYGYMLIDFSSDTVVPMNKLVAKNAVEPYFLNDENIIFCDMHNDGNFDVIRYNIPAAEQCVIAENTHYYSQNAGGFRFIHSSFGYGKHALLYSSEGIYLIDLLSCEKTQIPLTGEEYFTVSESPNGSSIFFGFTDQSAGGEVFNKIGVLNKEKGVLKMLIRQVETGSENLRGWINGDMPVITSADEQGGYFVYVYDFR